MKLQSINSTSEDMGPHCKRSRRHDDNVAQKSVLDSLQEYFTYMAERDQTSYSYMDGNKRLQMIWIVRPHNKATPLYVI